MKLPLGFGNIDFTDWVRGLFAAVISGGASGVTAGIVVSAKDPKHYAMGTANFFQVTGWVFVTTGVLSGAAFLRTRPLPDLKKVTTSLEVSQVGGGPVKTVATVTESHQEPAKP